jgi:hypothetical protein
MRMRTKLVGSAIAASMAAAAVGSTIAEARPAHQDRGYHRHTMAQHGMRGQAYYVRPHYVRPRVARVYRSTGYAYAPAAVQYGYGYAPRYGYGFDPVGGIFGAATSVVGGGLALATAPLGGFNGYNGYGYGWNTPTYWGQGSLWDPW